MSADLGSASGKISIDGGGVARGLDQAANAVSAFIAQVSKLDGLSIAPKLDVGKLGAGADAAARAVESVTDAAAAMGTAAARGVQLALPGFEQLDRAAENAGNAIERTAQSARSGLNQVASSSDQAAAAVDKVATRSQSAAQALDQLGNTAGVIGGALAAGLGLAIKSAGDLETAVARISTIAPEIDVSTVSRQLSQLSIDVGTSATDLAAAMNNVFSSIETNQSGALRLTEQFAKGAIAAGADAETFGSAILGVLNAYGLSVDQASHVSDVFFNTLDKGVIGGQQLASGLGQVTQAAKLAGVNFDTLGALIAGVTREGGDASTNVNNLANALNKITTTETQAGLQKLGIATKDASGNFRNIVTVLTELDAKLRTLSAGDRAKVLTDLFPDIQARAGVSVLLNQLGTVNDVLKSNAAAAGVADRAYEKMAGTAQAAGARLKATLVATLTEAGNIALPGLESVAKSVQGALVSFNNLSPEVKGAAVAAVEAAAAILLVGAAAVKAVSGVQALATAMQTLQAASVGVGGLATLGPLLAGVAIIAGVVAVGLKGTNDALSGTARVIDGELGAAIAKLKFSWQDMFFQGDANKIRQAVEDFAKGIDGTTPSLEEMRATLAKVNTEIAKLEGQTFRGFDDDQRLNQLRQTRQALEEVTRAEERRRAMYGPNGPTSDNESDRQYEIQVRKNTEALNENAEAERRRQAARNFNTPAPVNPITPYGIPESDLPTFDARAANILNEQAAAALAAQLAFEAYRASLNSFAQSNASAMQAIQGQLGPLNAALDAVNAKRAAGLPLTARENQLLADAPGSIAAATAAYNDLVIAQGAIAVQQQRASAYAGEQSTAFSGMGGSAGALAGQLTQLQGALVSLNSAFGALGSENAKLSAQYGLLGDRIAVLQAKAKEPLGLNGNEQTELDQLLTTQQAIGDQIGSNTQQQRDLVIAQQNTTTAAKETAAALEAINKADLEVKSDPFAFREDRRTATGPDLPPPAPVQVPVRVDPATKAQTEADIAGIGADTPPVKVPVELDTKGLTGGASVTAGLFAGAVQQQTVTVDVNDQATPTLQQIQQTLAEMNGQATTPSVGLADNASTPIAAIQGDLNTLGTTVTNPTITVQDDGTATIDGVAGALTTLDGQSANPVANVIDNASGPLGQIQNAIDTIPKSFQVTATVDISGALASIATLDANMPHSPAKEGPFRRLPNWDALTDDLGPSVERAVDGVRGPLGRIADLFGGAIDEASIKSARDAADTVRAVAEAAKAYAEASRELAGLDTAGLDNAGALRDGIAVLVRAFVDAAAAFDDDGLKAASSLASTASSIIGLIGPAVEGFAKLPGIVEPTGDQIGILAAGIGNLVLIMAETARLFSAEGLAGADLLAETAAKVLALVLPAIEGFSKLPGIIEPTGDQIGIFAAGVGNLTLILAQSAKLFTAQGLTGAGAIADVAAKVLALLIPAVDGFSRLPGIVEPTADQIGVFAAGITNLTLILAQSARLFTTEGLAAAGNLADTAAKVLALIVPAIEGIARLKAVAEPTAAQVATFGRGIVAIVAVVAQAATLFGTDLLAHAVTFADAAAKALGLIVPALDALARLAGGEVVALDPGRLAALVAGVRGIVAAIVAVAATLSVEGVAAGATFSDAASKMVALVGAAIAGFADLASFQGISDAQIAALSDAIERTIRALLVVAARFDQRAVEVGAAFSAAASTMVGLIGSALSALTTDLDKEGKPSKRFLSGGEIDQLIAVVEYAAKRLIAVAGGFDKGQLATIASFGDALGKGFAALREALDVVNITQSDKPKENSLAPAQVIDQLIAALTAGAARLPELVALADQYRNAANLTRMALAEVRGMLDGAALPTEGLSPALLAAGGTTTIVIRQERVFTGTLNLRMPADDGAFVARSLRVDPASLREVSSLLAGEFGEMLAQAE